MSKFEQNKSPKSKHAQQKLVVSSFNTTRNPTKLDANLCNPTNPNHQESHQKSKPAQKESRESKPAQKESHKSNRVQQKLVVSFSQTSFGS